MIFKPTDYSFPNLIIESAWTDDETRQINYRVTPAEGYVFYDPNDEYYEPVDPNDPESEQVRVYYYSVLGYLPVNFNFDNFPFVAVLRSSVDENYIFGVTPDTETI